MATALFANSPFTEGKPNGFLSARSEIWRDTDNNRAGMLPFAFEDGMGFERYVDYALDVPMYFIKRGDTYIDVAGKSFRDFFAGKLDRAAGRAADHFRLGQSSVDDLSRGAAQALSRNARRRWRAVAAAAVADRLLGRACSTTRMRSTPAGTWSRTGPREERQKLRDDVPALGFKAEIRGRNVLTLAQETLRFAARGLARRKNLDRNGRDETRYLRPLEEIDRARHHAGGGIAGKIPRRVERFGRSDFRRVCVLTPEIDVMAKSTPATLALEKAGVAFKLHEYDYDPNAARIGMQAAEASGSSRRGCSRR